MNNNRGVPMKVSILSRISTSDQSNESGLQELRELCSQKGYEVVEEYVEVVSGSKGKDERKELQRMLSDCKKGKFEKLIVWELSRLGRSLSHLVTTLQEMSDCGGTYIQFVKGLIHQLKWVKPCSV